LTQSVGCGVVLWYRIIRHVIMNDVEQYLYPPTSPYSDITQKNTI